MSLLDNASLLLTPNAYKEGKLYSVIPSNGNGDFTATRATTATRVNSQGLVDLVPYNLVQYSEQFDNSYWAKDTGVSVNANVANAPNETTTADRINFSVVSAIYRSPLALGTGSFTFSVWLKAEGANIGKQILLEFTNGNSTVTLTGDWQRFTTVGSNATFVSIKRNTISQADSVLAWGAQIVEGTSARDYLRTETRLNIPRVDYSLGGCPNILLEPQRTNLALQSSSFDDASWTKLNGSVTANTTIAPNGTTTADTFTANGASFPHFLQTNAISFVSGITYTSTIYAKKGTNNFIQLIAATTTGGQFANFDLNNGVVGTLGTVSGSNPTASIESVGDGWYRCVMTFTTTASASAVFTFAIVTSASAARGEVNSLSTSVFLWGAQLEAGAYATSFIPTTTSSVTRNADSITRNNIFTNGLITAAGGTWFVEFRNNVPLIRQTNGGLLFTDASSNNYFNFYHPSSSSRILIAKAIGGTFSNIYTTTTNTAKIAIKWNGTTADVFVNGAKVVSATAFTATALENLSCNGASNPFNINEMALFPTPLTDAQCLALTA